MDSCVSRQTFMWGLLTRPPQRRKKDREREKGGGGGGGGGGEGKKTENPKHTLIVAVVLGNKRFMSEKISISGRDTSIAWQS